MLKNVSSIFPFSIKGFIEHYRCQALGWGGGSVNTPRDGVSWVGEGCLKGVKWLRSFLYENPRKETDIKSASALGQEQRRAVGNMLG